MRLWGIKWTMLSLALPLCIGVVALALPSNLLAFATIAVLMLSPLMIRGEYRRLREVK